MAQFMDKYAEMVMNDVSRNEEELRVWQDRKKNMAIKCKHLWIEANKEIWSGKYYSGYTFYDNHYKPKGGGRGA